MPWEVVREGATLHVKISAPIADWGSLAIEIDNHLDPPPTVVTLPASIPGGTALDTRMLRLTWDELMDRGIGDLPRVRCAVGPRDRHRVGTVGSPGRLDPKESSMGSFAVMVRGRATALTSGRTSSI